MSYTVGARGNLGEEAHAAGGHNPWLYNIWQGNGTLCRLNDPTLVHTAPQDEADMAQPGTSTVVAEPEMQSKGGKTASRELQFSDAACNTVTTGATELDLEEQGTNLTTREIRLSETTIPSRPASGSQ